MLKEYPKFKRGEIWKFYDKLSSSENKLIEEYITYRKARGVSAARDLLDIKRYILQLRYILQKDLRKIDLNEVRQITAIINTSWLKNEVRNGLKIDFKNFLKYIFPDWSVRFADLEDIKQSSKSRNEEKINAQTIYTKEDIQKLMKHETKLFYKAFLITQYEAGLRTGECRTLKWDSIRFNVDNDISEVAIYSTKTSKARTIFVKEATFYLQKLKEEQENTGMKSIYVFPSNKKNEPIDKTTISKWFRSLTKKALGRQGWSYLLRHSRATELYRLADENKISKEIAIKFMGHSSDMSKTYTHLDKQEIKNMLKNQVYKLEELPEEKKNELELEIERLKKDEQIQKDKLERLEREFRDLFENFKHMTGGLKISHDTAVSNKSVEEKFRKTAKHLISKNKLSAQAENKTNE